MDTRRCLQLQIPIRRSSDFFCCGVISLFKSFYRKDKHKRDISWANKFVVLQA